MTTNTALKTVLIWAAAFACVGCAMGAVIGALAPEYYRAVFRGGESPDFNPLQVGAGLGATQGAASGMAISIVVPGVTRMARSSRRKECRSTATPRQRIRSREHGRSTCFRVLLPQL